MRRTLSILAAARRPAALVVVAGSLTFATRSNGTLASWGPEWNLSATPTDSETGLNHRPLAFTPDGTLHVVWAEEDGANETYRIYTRRMAAAGWTPSELIVDYLDTDPGGPGDHIGAKYPSLAAEPGGDLHLFWHDYRVAGIDNVEIYTKALPVGGEWETSRIADVRLTTTSHPEAGGDNGYVPVPVASAGGDLHVVWYDYRYDGNAGEILAKNRPSGGSWDLTPGDSADTRITFDPEHSELVDAVVDGMGDVHCVWRGVSGGARIHYSRRDAGTGDWSLPETVDLAGMVLGAPATALDASGSVHVVWPDGRDGGRALYTRIRDGAGTWSAEARLTRPGDGADEPSLASEADGTIHLVWSDGRESLLNREIFHRSKSNGGAWDTTYASDARLSVGVGHSTRPSAVAENGRVVVIWKDARDGNHDVYVRRGGPLGTGVVAAFPSSAPTLRAAPNPFLAGAGVRLISEAPLGEVSIHDVTGRRIRTLPGPNPGGWDGRIDSGALVPAGIYFLRAPGVGSTRVTVRR